MLIIIAPWVLFLAFEFVVVLASLTLFADNDKIPESFDLVFDRFNLVRYTATFLHIHATSYGDEELTWYRTFEKQARAQNVYDVLDSSYVPSKQDEKDLFDAQRKFMYAVLQATVLTSNGKSIVRDHANDYDAQMVYCKIQDHHTRSARADFQASSLLTYITSARLGDGDWRGTTENFIIHWEEQIRTYERITDYSHRFPGEVKRTMLENAVNSIS